MKRRISQFDAPRRLYVLPQYVLSNRVAISLLVLITGRAVVAAELSETASKLINANESSLGLLHSFDVTLELWHTPLLAEKADAKPQLTGIWRWSMSGDRERVRDESFTNVVHSRAAAKSIPSEFSDVFLDEGFEYEMRGWDPDNPVKISPIHQQNVKGYVRPRTELLPAYLADPATMLLFRVRSTRQEAQQRHTLSELARTSLEVQELPERDGLRGLRFVREKPGEVKDVVSQYDVFLDPKQGYLATKIIEYYPNYTWHDASGAKTIPVRWVREVSKMRAFANGVYFPIETTMVIHRDDQKDQTALFRAAVVNAKVNEPLPKDALDFKFPEHLLVQYPVADGRNPVKLWGPNNKPVADVDDMKDLSHYLGIEASDLGPLPEEDSDDSSRVLIFANIVIVCVVAILLIRKIRSA